MFLGTEANPSIMISLQTLLRNGKISISSFFLFERGEGKGLEKEENSGILDGFLRTGKDTGLYSSVSSGDMISLKSNAFVNAGLSHGD